MKPRVPQDQTPARASSLVRPTTVIQAPRLARRLGVEMFLASETFQETGSFKFRAACQVASRAAHHRFITASSGNFGQALARACQLLGKSCVVVMPQNSAQVKIDAVREFGGTVELIDVRQISRQQRVAQLAEQDQEAYVASAYDDDHVIEGNASLGEELGRLPLEFNTVIAPVGGGGLTAGLIQGLRQTARTAAVYGVEPVLANDAARSLRHQRLVANDQEPATLADGVRTLSLGQRNWAILQTGLEGIVEVPEEMIGEAVRLLFDLANLKAEPTGALAVAALLAAPGQFRGHQVCCLISGGNVDPATYARLVHSKQA